jgi:copper chaperone
MTETQLRFLVPTVSCGHCVAAITSEVKPLQGVHSVNVDLDAKEVTVTGQGLNSEAIRAAIAEAGFEVVT